MVMYIMVQHNGHTDELIGELYSIAIPSQYGNHLMNNKYIDFSCEKNVNNLTLEEAFENIKLIRENMGAYALDTRYELYFVEDTEIVDSIEIHFDKMIELCKGGSLEVNGIEYTKEYFTEPSGLAKLNSYGEVKIGNDITAIKYIEVYNQNDQEEIDHVMYIFIDGENIYNIVVPIDERVSEYVQDFLNSIEKIG